MSAKDYAVSFAYGAYDGQFYTAARPHRGNDRPCPKGTPVVIEGITIGLTGATGAAYDGQGRKGTDGAAHLHTQAGTDEWCQQAFNPGALEFKAGTVVHAGTASEWGKYIIIKVKNAYICYAHLSEIKVKEGQVIKAPVKVDPDMKTDLTKEQWESFIRRVYLGFEARTPSPTEVDFHMKNSNPLSFVNGTKEFKWQKQAAEVASLKSQVASVTSQLEGVKNQLQSALSKPADVVVKEVEKIVEKPIEIVKEVEKPANWQTVVNFIREAVNKFLNRK